MAIFWAPEGIWAATSPFQGADTSPEHFVGQLPRISSELAPGRLPRSEMDIGLGFAVGSFLGLAAGSQEDTPPGLVAGPSLGRGPGKGQHTLPQPVPGMALGSSEDMEEAHRAACTADH